MDNSTPAPKRPAKRGGIESAIAPWAAFSAAGAVLGIFLAGADGRLILLAFVAGAVWLTCVIVAAVR